MTFQRSGPSAEPCVTPAVTLLRTWPVMVLYVNSLSCRWSSITRKRYGGTPNRCSRAPRISFHLAELNVFLTSRVTKTQASLDLRLACHASCAVVITSLMAPIVDLCRRNYRPTVGQLQSEVFSSATFRRPCPGCQAYRGVCRMTAWWAGLNLCQGGPVSVPSIF